MIPVTCDNCGCQFMREPANDKGEHRFHNRACFYDWLAKNAKYQPQAMYDFIVDYCRKHTGLPPAVNVIRDELGYSSNSVVTSVLEKLIEAGRITKGPAGKIQVVGAVWDVPEDLEWTTDRPTRSGYFWAYEDLDPLTADVVLVFIDGYGLQKGHVVCLSPFTGEVLEIDFFSHFMSAVIFEPQPPKETA